MVTSPCCNSVAGHQIAANFYTCHDSTAVVPCTKFCSDHCIGIKMRAKHNFHRIWIAMEKPLVKRAPDPGWCCHCGAKVLGLVFLTNFSQLLDFQFLTWILIGQWQWLYCSQTEATVENCCLLTNFLQIHDSWHIEAKAKMPPFSGWYFEKDFPEWWFMNFDWIS